MGGTLLTRGQLCWMFASWSLSAAALAQDLAPAGAQAGQQLLELSWEARGARRAEADAYYWDARSGAWEVEQAYALGLISQGRHREALLAARRLHDLRPDSPEVARLWLWLAAANRDYVAALNAAAQLAKQAELTPRGRDSAALVGALLGFLDGLPRGAPDQARRQETRIAIEASLPRVLLPAFHQAREAVRQRHAQFEAELQQVAARRDAEAAAQRQQKLNELDQQKLAAQQLQNQLDQWRQLVQQQAQAESQTLQQNDWQLAQESSRVGADAYWVSRDLGWVYWELLRLSRLRGGDGRRQGPYWDWLLTQLSLSALGLDWDLDALQYRLEALAWQRGALAARQFQLEQQVAAEARRLNSQQRRLDLAQRRFEAKAMQAQKARPSSGGELSLRARAASFATFAPVDLETERAQFLRGIGQPAQPGAREF